MNHVLVKEPGTQETTPWHHDMPYYGVNGDQLCSVWLPLDEVPKSVCPEYVAGSHASGVLYYPRMFVSHENYSAGVDGFESVPDIDAHRDQYEILSWELGLGDCLVFHMRTVHSAPSTLGLKSRRRGFSSRWLGDDARFATRPWTTSPPYPRNTPETRRQYGTSRISGGLAAMTLATKTKGKTKREVLFNNLHKISERKIKRVLKKYGSPIKRREGETLVGPPPPPQWLMPD